MRILRVLVVLLCVALAIFIATRGIYTPRPGFSPSSKSVASIGRATNPPRPPPAAPSPPDAPNPPASEQRIPESRPSSLRDRLQIVRTIYVHDQATNRHREKQRVEIVASKIDFPLVRLVETIRTNPATLAEEITHTEAMVANRVLLTAAGNFGQLVETARESGLRLTKVIEPNRTGVFEFAIGDTDTLPAVLQALHRQPAVAAAEPDYLLWTQLNTDDPWLPSDWEYLQSIGVPTAWDTRTDASNIVVAVVDTGMRLSHEDLSGNVWRNPGEAGHETNGVDDDGDGYVDDVNGINAIDGSGDPTDQNGHGTHVAGIIGAIGNNGKGIAGVAWHVQLMPLKFLDARGIGTTSDAVACIDFARAKHVSIINASWGGPAESQVLREAIEACDRDGIVFVAAAGNDGVDLDTAPMYPAAYNLPNLVTVASASSDHSLSSFSNYGAALVAAPGERVVSCWNSSDSAYRSASGTSMATPYVSGALALLRAQFGGETPEQSIDRLLAGSKPVPALADTVLSGRMLDVTTALTHATYSAIPHPTFSDLSATVAIGGAIDLAPTTVGGTGPFTYQWKFDGADIPGATEATLRLTNVQPDQSGRYSLSVRNSAGTAHSRSLVLMAIGPPTITRQPQSQTAAVGTDVNLSIEVRANGGSSVRYQWYFNAAPLAQQTGSDLTLTGVTPAQAGTYRVTATTELGTTTSQDAILSVVPAIAPSITAEPADVTSRLDETATFSVAATGSAPLRYQWYRNGVILAGQTADSLSIVRAQQSDVGTYSVVVSNTGGAATSRSAKLSVGDGAVAPFIVQQPVDRSVAIRETATFAVVAKGTPDPAYQWQHDGIDIPAATQPTLTILQTQKENAGEYRVRISNQAGSTLSDSAFLTVDSVRSILPWEWRSPTPQGNDLFHIKYHSGSFYALGLYGTIMTSPNAVGWTLRDSGTTCQFRGLAWDATQMIAVGTAGTIVASTDNGVTWSRRYSGTKDYLDAIAYGNGVFVVSGASGAVLVSSNGQTWTRYATGAQAGPYDITFGNGMFMAVGAGGAAMRSVDGKTWTSASTGSLGDLLCVAYGNGTFVAGSVFGSIVRSTDGVHWTTTIQDGRFWQSVTYDHGIFFAIDGRGNHAVISPDGVTWSERTGVTPGFAYGVAYGANTWVVVGEAGTVRTSPDTTTWTTRCGGSLTVLSSATYGPAGYVAAAGAYTLNSTDGVRWLQFPTSAYYTSITYLNGRYIGCAIHSTIGTSIDGRQWSNTNVSSDPNLHLTSVAFGTGIYVTVGVSGVIATSSDLQTWTPQVSGTPHTLTSIVYDGTQFIAVGEGGVILTSPDGATWTPRASGTPNNLYAAASDGRGNTVAVGAFQTVAHSTDGSTWATSSPGLLLSPLLSTVVYVDGYFIAAGVRGTLLLSTDGTTWTERTATGTPDIEGLAYDGKSFVAVGTDLTILQSPGFADAPGSVVPVPRTQVALAGQPIKLAISTVGGADVSYQWKHDGTPLPGKTGPSLDVRSSAYADAGLYSVEITSGTGSVESQPAYVTVVGSSPEESTVGSNGGTVLVHVSAPPTITWTAATVDGNVAMRRAGGIGTDVAYFTVAPNPSGLDRTLDVVVAGQTISVDQKVGDSRLVNVSTRGRVDSPLVAGFVTTGSTPKRLLVRAAGPGLADFGVSDPLANPRLELYRGSTRLSINDSWESQEPTASQWTALTGAFPFLPRSKDALLTATLDPANYTATVSSGNAGEAGTALVEVYEVMDQNEALADRRMVNISTRGEIANDTSLVAGFVVAGNVPRRVLIRGMGPSLARYGIANFVPDPRLTLYQGRTVIAQNDNWSTADTTEVSYATSMTGAFPFASTLESAIVISLAPGAYTAEVTTADGQSGIGMVEVYEAK